MKHKEYLELSNYHAMAKSIADRINRLESFLAGLQYRLRENPTAMLELDVRRERGSHGYDIGANLKIRADLVGKIILPLVQEQLAQARKDFAELPPAKAQGWKAPR